MGESVVFSQKRPKGVSFVARRCVPCVVRLRVQLRIQRALRSAQGALNAKIYAPAAQRGMQRTELRIFDFGPCVQWCMSCRFGGLSDLHESIEHERLRAGPHDYQ